MKKTLKTICTLFATIIATFIFIGASINAKAETMPIGAAQTLPLERVLSFESGYNYYRTLDIPSSGLLKFHNISNYPSSIEIRDMNNNEVYSSSYGVSDFSKYFRAGQYSIRISTNYRDTQVVFYLTSANESFPETETVNNDTIETASVISNLDNTTYRGVISKTDDYDWYKFYVPSTCDLIINIHSLTDGTSPEFLLEDANENYVTDAKGNGEFSYSLNPGTYYLRVGYYAQVYTLQFKTRLSSDLANIKVGKFKVTSSKRGKLNIKWSKVKNKNVAGYEIKVATDKSFYNTIATYDVKKSAKSKKITIPPYYRGRKIFVKVRAFNYSNSKQKNYSKDGKIISVRAKK